MKLFLKDISSILGLRKTGKQIREDIEKAVNSGDTVEVDFDGVESVSSSFADEFVAKLYIDFGSEKFLNNIKFKNVNETIKTIINSTIRDRLRHSA